VIDFLSPLYLLAGAAAAIPLFIHLLRRRIGTKVEFPAVRYLARAEREHSRKLRLRNLLLMLLRVVAVIIIAAAAARPVARVVGSGHAPTAVAIVIDNSLSTSAVVGGTTVLTDLKAQAREVVGRASGADRLWLVTADGVVRGGTRAVVLDAIDRIDHLPGAGDMGQAMARAASLVREAPLPEREVALLTDAQRTAWPRSVPLEELRILVYRPRAAPPPNRGVVAADAVPSRWTPRGAVRARVQAPDSATYRISLEGRSLARGTVARDEEILVRAAPAERGWTSGAVELEPDEMRGDDERFFAVWIGPPPAVTPHPALGVFTRSAVDALVDAERVALGNDISIVSADQATRLPALLIAPEDPVRGGAANRALERLGVPWRLGTVRRGTAAARAEGVQARELEGVTVSVRYQLELRGGAATDTLALAAGEPWIVSGPGYVLLGSPLVPEATTLPVRAAFVPWLSDVVSQRLTEGAGIVIAGAPGSVVVRPPEAEALELPGGQRMMLSGDSLAVPPAAGVSFFMRGPERVGALVVNPEAAESVLDRYDDNGLRARLRGRDVRVISDSARWRTAAFDSAPRRPVIMPLLLLAVVTLLVESAMAGGGRAKAA
jgi:hypothetical protein